MSENQSDFCDIHHMIPISRGGPEVPWNEKRDLRKKHRAWNTIFGAKALPCEALFSIRKSWKTYFLPLLRKTRPKKLRGKKAKKYIKKQLIELLFGPRPYKEDVIDIIKTEWTPKHPSGATCFQFKECRESYGHNKICPLLKLSEKGDLK